MQATTDSLTNITHKNGIDLMVLNIPTQLTILRLLMVPMVLLCLFIDFPGHRAVAVVIYVVAALTDTLDGYLARKWDQSTPFGAFLDPVADKLMVAAICIALVLDYMSIWIAIAAIIIISREILISALREWMAEEGARDIVAVSQLGKLKTWLQMLALGFLLWQTPTLGLPIATIGMVLLGGAVALTLYSLFDYFKAAWPILSGKSR